MQHRVRRGKKQVPRGPDYDVHLDASPWTESRRLAPGRERTARVLFSVLLSRFRCFFFPSNVHVGVGIDISVEGGGGGKGREVFVQAAHDPR